MYPTASCHQERKSGVKTGHRSPTRTTSIHQHMTGAAAYVPRHIEKEEKPGMRQFGEALGEPEVPQWPTRQLHWMRGVVRGKEEAGPGIFRTQLGLPGWSILGAPGPGPPPPHPPSSSSPPASWLFTRGAACQQRKCILFPAQEFTPSLGQLLNKASFLSQS